MSAGHTYREDGWCAHARCMRHHKDPPDFSFCPDTSGYRKDLPRDKRAKKDEVLGSQVRILGAALLKRIFG